MLHLTLQLYKRIPSTDAHLSLKPGSTRSRSSFDRAGDQTFWTSREWTSMKPSPCLRATETRRLETPKRKYPSPRALSLIRIIVHLPSHDHSSHIYIYIYIFIYLIVFVYYYYSRSARKRLGRIVVLRLPLPRHPSALRVYVCLRLQIWKYQ